MVWQDAVFLAGSIFSILVLTPTLRDSVATVPMGTSIPSAGLGVVYGATFFTMGMTFSASGSLLTGILWALIAALRSPQQSSADETGSISEVRSRLDWSSAD